MILSEDWEEIAVSSDRRQYFELEEYIKQGEPEQSAKCKIWQTAIGLQDVDGLVTSAYLLATAKEHIAGKIDIQTAKARIQEYYEERRDRGNAETDTKEADLVSVRIAELLSERSFQFSPVELQTIHRRLFTGIFDHAGRFRTYNITKREWVLNGETVFYAPHDSIRDTLKYDFDQEKNFSYEGLAISEAVKHIAKFTSGVWQIHPFCEGNTRSTAVFVIRYLHTFGFQVSNDVFAENSWYFRNALVRANYKDLQKGVCETTKFLEMFFENLLLGYHNDLKNRYLHVDYDKASVKTKSAKIKDLKCHIGTFDCTMEEFAIIKIMAENPRITQKELAALSGKSERTIKRRTVEMQQKGLIERENGKRTGRWMICSEGREG